MAAVWFVDGWRWIFTVQDARDAVYGAGCGGEGGGWWVDDFAVYISWWGLGVWVLGFRCCIHVCMNVWMDGWMNEMVMCII